MRVHALRGVLLACLMKLCTKITETLFTIEDPSNFRLSDEAGSLNESCHFSTELSATNSQASITTWIYTLRYSLPVLGGLISSVWFGTVAVLQIGGIFMLLSTVLLSVSVYLGFMCQASPIITVTWLLLPVFYGLTQPSIVHCMFSWFKRPKFFTIVSATYYAVSVTGKYIALLLLPLNKAEWLGPNSSVIYIAISVLFVALPSFFPVVSREEPFEMPTLFRMSRYFQIFSVLIIFLFAVDDTRSAVYATELEYYLNATANIETYFWLSPKTQNLSAMLVSCVALIIAASISRRQLPVGLRMQAGILLGAAVAASLTVFTAVAKKPGYSAVVTVYTAASILDAAAEVLVMTGAYDLLQQITPGGTESFVIGIMFTVWGLANLASQVALLTMSRWLQPLDDDHPKLFVYHLVSVMLLLVCSAYHKIIALPLAAQVTPTEILNEEETVSELQPLLSSDDV